MNDEPGGVAPFEVRSTRGDVSQASYMRCAVLPDVASCTKGIDTPRPRPVRAQGVEKPSNRSGMASSPATLWRPETHKWR